MSNARYARQTILKEIGVKGQDRLARASVLCVGVGGLGSPAALYLAAAGVGRIGLVDFDVVDETNLQRQILYTSDDVDRPKALQARDRLAAFNPQIKLEAHNTALSAANACQLFEAYDVILDGTDNFSTKFLINDAAYKTGKPWVYGAIQNFDGQVAVFGSAAGPCYRCLYPEPPKARIMNCAEAGVLGAVVGLVGVTQALQAIQLLVGDGGFEPLIGKLWLLDGKTMTTQTLAVARNPQCAVCAHARDAVTLPQDAAGCVAVREVAASKLATLASNFVMVDVREQSEWAQGHVPNAVLAPLSSLEAGDNCVLPRDVLLVVYCQRGARSRRAVEILAQRGYQNMLSLAGGYQAWLQQGPQT